MKAEQNKVDWVALARHAEKTLGAFRVVEQDGRQLIELTAPLASALMAVEGLHLLLASTPSNGRSEFLGGLEARDILVLALSASIMSHCATPGSEPVNNLDNAAPIAGTILEILERVSRPLSSQLLGLAVVFRDYVEGRIPEQTLSAHMAGVVSSIVALVAEAEARIIRGGG